MGQFKGFAGASEAQLKQLWSFLFAQESVGLAADGVIVGLGVTQTTTAGASVLVGAGMGVVQDSVGNGSAPMANNAQVTLDVLGANPMGATPRNDIVVFDAATTNNATELGGIRVIVGTPNAVPTDPAVPATAVKLARLRHAASATTVPAAKIDDLRAFTSLAMPSTLALSSLTVGGVAVPNIKAVALSGTTDSLGYLVSTHGLGFTPTAVLCFNSGPGSTFAVFWGADAIGATTFRTRWHDARDGFSGTHDAYLENTAIAFTAVCFG